MYIAPMEFWGAEVKSGEPLVAKPHRGYVMKISQACLGETKKGKEHSNVLLSVEINGKKILLGTLSSKKFPHLSLDLVLEKDFELSHTAKHGSVYFSGFQIARDDYFVNQSDSKPDMNAQLAVLTKKVAGKQPETEKSQTLFGKPKLDSTGPMPKVKIVKFSSDDETEDSSSDDDCSDEDDTDSKGKSSAEDDETSDSDETPLKLRSEQGKKRLAESAKKTPVLKKIKLISPLKTHGKKSSGHMATPYPSKKSQKQSQKSLCCKRCNKTFGSESALQDHTRAKHSA